jgi:hypothetical protein
MLDEFREQAINSDFFEEEEDPSEEGKSPPVKRKFLGMTAAQRFLIALMLLLMTCVMGTFILAVTGKVIL